MAEKLKLILRQIHWSLVLKAVAFALVWFLFPFWVFVLVALYLYFVPLFQAQKLFIPFLTLIILTYIAGQTLFFALIFGVLFYYLLLIKDLFLIDRKSAYELMVLALSFFLVRDFYQHFGNGIITGASLWYGILIAALIGLLINAFIRSFSETSHRAAMWLAFLLAWQFLILGLFLPLDFIYQSVIIFLVLILIIDFVPEHSLGGIPRQKLLIAGSAIGAFLVIVLASTPWRI